MRIYTLQSDDFHLLTLPERMLFLLQEYFNSYNLCGSKYGKLLYMVNEKLYAMFYLAHLQKLGN